MTGGEGSRPVYSYNRGKRVRENAYVRRASRLRKSFAITNRKASAKKQKKTKKSSRTARLRVGLNRIVRKFYG